MIEFEFDKGSLIFSPSNDLEILIENFKEITWDRRTKNFRSLARFYRKLVLHLIENKISFSDKAKQYEGVTFTFKKNTRLFTHQIEALDQWNQNNKIGTICLPTGSGKTLIAVLAIEQTKRPTMICVPTIDLMQQWYHTLTEYFENPIGLIGGGYHEPAHLTVVTYDSARLYAESLGNRYGFLICDESHHLPSEYNQVIADAMIAPYRLGLTATPERQDGKESILYELIGPIVYRGEITEMSGSVLADYEVVSLEVSMTNDDEERYKLSRNLYLSFLKKHRIYFQKPSDWNYFIRIAARSTEGRAAFKAYLEQKQLAQASATKIHAVWDLICKHRGDRILIFTQDNKMAYHIGKTFLLPVITHHTKTKERKKFLDYFRNGTFCCLVTSKVLNEGVDVPDANIGIVVSGSGSVREHVQRLGRILRNRPQKKAVLYEIISKNTAEYFVNQRRRQHRAYQRNAEIPET